MSHSSIIVTEARAWIGTPYVHQAATKGAGTDCLGLIFGIWRKLYGPFEQSVPPYSSDWAEADQQEVLWEAALHYLIAKPQDKAEIGDVLLFRMRTGAIAKHLGVQTELYPKPYFIHAYSGHSVAETALSSPWAHRVVARFAFPKKVL